MIIKRYDIAMALDWGVGDGASLREELTDEATSDGGRVESITWDGRDFIVEVAEDDDERVLRESEDAE